MATCDIVLHPTDFSDEADEAFRMACSIARDQFATVVVMHVLPPSFKVDCETEAPGDPTPEVKRCLDEFRRMKTLETDIPVRFRVVAGYPVGMILNVACEECADLIVMASSHRNKTRLQLHGLVADGVLRQAHCPVFCLKLPAVGFAQDNRKSVDALSRRREVKPDRAASSLDD